MSSVNRLYSNFRQCRNFAAFMSFMRGIDVIDQIKLAEFILESTSIKAHTVRDVIDDSMVLYHPIEEEIVKAIASGVDVKDFMAQYISTHPESSASMLRRRYYKIAHLLQVYQAYSDPPLQINLEWKP